MMQRPRIVSFALLACLLTCQGCFVYLERHHGDLRVKVLDSATGAPISGAAVQVIEGRLPVGGEPEETVERAADEAAPPPAVPAEAGLGAPDRVLCTLSTDSVGEARVMESEYDLALFMPLPT
ncbi:MAG: hypothetical protein ACYTFT_03195 [Planctomycetota bacterium]|jgi:hypothetical protein